MVNFAEKLSKLQADAGETNYRLAKEIGVHQTSISNWKSGIYPHPKHIKLLAEHFGVPIDYFSCAERGTAECKTQKN